jgi:hypothetical protein
MRNHKVVKGEIKRGKEKTYMVMWCENILIFLATKPVWHAVVIYVGGGYVQYMKRFFSLPLGNGFGPPK